jgi:hypothetical protein
MTELRRAIQEIQSWSREDRMPLKYPKCGILQLIKRETQRWKYKELCGIPFVKHYKYLGVTLDERLNMN